jgi:hypothetical protein
VSDFIETTDVSCTGSNEYGSIYEVRCVCGALVYVNDGLGDAKCLSCGREWGHITITATASNKRWDEATNDWEAFPEQQAAQ